MDRVDDVAVRTLLPDCDQSMSRDVDAKICKQAIGARRDFRRRARDLPVDLAIAKIDEIDGAASDGIAASAITIDLRSHIERGRRHVADRAVRGSGDEDVAALLERPSLDPIDGVAVNPRLAECAGFGHGRIGGDGRDP
jgi:hypothetical protein